MMLLTATHKKASAHCLMVRLNSSNTVNCSGDSLNSPHKPAKKSVSWELSSTSVLRTQLESLCRDCNTSRLWWIFVGLEACMATVMARGPWACTGEGRLAAALLQSRQHHPKIIRMAVALDACNSRESQRTFWGNMMCHLLLSVLP